MDSSFSKDAPSWTLELSPVERLKSSPVGRLRNWYYGKHTAFVREQVESAGVELDVELLPEVVAIPEDLAG